MTHQARGGGDSPRLEQLIDRLAEQSRILQQALDLPAIVERLPGSDEYRHRPARIFVVHGHNDARKNELMRLLDHTLVDAKAVVLHEQVNRGATIVEKLERHAQEASYAVVLLTGDDEARRSGDDGQQWERRARQNVILELGFFVGLLGRAKVTVIKERDIAEPSDLGGLAYITLDVGGAWRYKLLKEIAAAGIEVNPAEAP